VDWDARLGTPNFSIRAEFMVPLTIPGALPEHKIGAFAAQSLLAERRGHAAPQANYNLRYGLSGMWITSACGVIRSQTRESPLRSLAVTADLRLLV
jgi:hypothetical protein